MEKNQISPELNAKVKKNLMWFFIFAVMMIFAGFTSGYIVQQGERFWVNISMPSGFNWSTVIIFVSSFFLILAKRAAKKNNQKGIKISLGFALLCGILFGVFQFMGFTQLVGNGITARGNIMNLKGRYADHYTLLYQSKEISYDDTKYYWKGEEVSDELYSKMKIFAKELMDNSRESRRFNLPNYGSELMLKYEGELVTYMDNKLMVDNVELDFNKIDYLWFFAETIVNEKGDFTMKGEYGKDFWIYYKSEKVDYSHRKFFINGQAITDLQREKLYNEDNQASSFIYVFTAMHLLHWLGGVIALLVMFIRGLGSKYTDENYLGITLGTTYWHFLGILWLYLYAFLIFIH